MLAQLLTRFEIIHLAGPRGSSLIYIGTT